MKYGIRLTEDEMNEIELLITLRKEKLEERANFWQEHLDQENASTSIEECLTETKQLEEIKTKIKTAHRKNA